MSALLRLGVLLVAAACPVPASAWSRRTGSGRPLREWAIPARVGTFSCLDCTNHGLVGGTTDGYVARFPVEQNVRPSVARLSDGQPLLHAQCKHNFVGGAFYDPALQRYVVRTQDATGGAGPFQTLHHTHVVGGGFMRVHLDMCYCSISIDGMYVVSSLRRGIVLKIGRLADLVGPGITPTCVSVVEDGVVAVGTHDGRVYVLDMERQQVNSFLACQGKGVGAPLAIHAIRADGSPRPGYLLAWTSAQGHVSTGCTTRRPVSKSPFPIRVTSAHKVGDAGLVKIRISEEAATMTVQSDAGKTYLVRSHADTELMEGCWMLPIPCLDNFVWHSNEKNSVALLYYEDIGASATCDS